MTLYDNIFADLKECTDPSFGIGQQMFFKEKIKLLGIRTPKARTVARKYAKQIKSMPKADALNLIKMLFSDGYLETFVSGLELLEYRLKDLDNNDYDYLYGILSKDVDNWAKCDGFCTGILSQYFYKNQSLIPKLKEYNKSSEIWVKRASLVSFIAGKTKNQLLRQEFELAKSNALNLINDKEDLIQKACGWLLREMYKIKPLEMSEFIYTNRKRMARTTLRYAIEKMSDNRRKEMME